MPQTRAKSPKLEEIRDAMLNECRNGCIKAVTTVCEYVVKIACYYKQLVLQ